MKIYLLSIGLISILGQVVLLRELNVSFYGVELIYLLAVGVWLLWTAVGAVIGRRNGFPASGRIAGLFVIFAVAIPLAVVFIRSSRLILGSVPGAYLIFLHQLVVLVIALLPAGVLSGLLFQWAAREYVKERGTLAVAYAIESAGGLVGGLFGSLFIMLGLRNLSIAFICALVSALTPAITLTDFRKSPLFRITVAVAGVLLLLLWQASVLDHRMTQWNHPNLLDSADSPYGRITVTRSFHQISVFENDALSFETEGTDAESFCHLAALQHPNPQTVLILGGGLEGLVGDIAKYASERIDYVELNPVMLKQVTPYLPDGIRKPLEAQNVHITVADPRQYLKTSGTYDLILVGMPEPTSGQANRFYTKEFFEQCSAKLNPAGILAFRLRAAENLWTKALVRRNMSIYKALGVVFPEVLFLPGTMNIVTASHSPLSRSPAVLSQRLQNRNILTRLVSPNYIVYLFTNDRFFTIRDLFTREKILPNTDIRPVCYQYAFIIWLSKFYPRISLLDLSSVADRGLFKPPLVFIWIGLILLFALSRYQTAIRRTALVFVAGFVGMVMETVLILYYQVKHGVLYQDIGLLLMSFMVGLAAGAMAIDREIARTADRPVHLWWYGFVLLAGFSLLCALTGILVSMSLSVELIQISCLMAATGFLVAGVFAYASLCNIEDQNRVISPLYAADLIGGCLGSLLAGLILIPLWGMDAAAWGMLLLSAISILLV